MARTVRNNTIRRLHLGLAAACALFAASTPALACNPFELLFGGCRETQILRPEAPAYYAPETRREAPRSAEKAKPAHVAATNSNGISARQKPIAASPAAPVGSMALFEKDRTLRAGDVVVTTDGFRKYEGGGSFTPIAHDGGRLATLEKASFERKPSEQDAAPAPIVASDPVHSPFGLRSHARARLSSREVSSGG